MTYLIHFKSLTKYKFFLLLLLFIYSLINNSKCKAVPTPSPKLHHKMGTKYYDRREYRIFPLRHVHISSPSVSTVSESDGWRSGRQFARCVVLGPLITQLLTNRSSFSRIPPQQLLLFHRFDSSKFKGKTGMS